ncbi:hypothetical protein J6590_034046 [Homalodisca vitripennis]|nr:hypothetical protein J6590_034046 [Homalodisca vitripennis]
MVREETLERAGLPRLIKSLHKANLSVGGRCNNLGALTGLETDLEGLSPPEPQPEVQWRFFRFEGVE